ncbi:MAG: hypothetical protein EYC70_15475 [Planctomycetota bacterium]|nr:MAG: hypothetical protein EYC70_15475 [Planctomycetota bacterium]
MSALLPVLLLAAQAPAQDVTLALTAGGRAVEASDVPAPGARNVETPYGVFHTPSDPVAVTATQRVHRDWAGMPWPVPTFAARQLVDGVAGAGHLSELLELAAYAEERDTGAVAEELTVAACRALESWGRELDPVPPRTAFGKRVDWLWRALLADGGPRVLLLGGRLMAELQTASTGQPAALGLADIRDALDARSPFVRRAGALAAADQKLGDITLAPLLLDRSLRDGSAAARDGAAQAASILWPDYSRNFWYESVARASESERAAAAFHLARYGGAQTLDYLAFTLSGYDKKAPNRYVFAGRDVQIVVDVRSASVPIAGVIPGECNTAVFYPAAPATDSFTNVSVVKITRLTPAITEVLVRALELWSGGAMEREAGDWLTWYLEQ